MNIFVVGVGTNGTIIGVSQYLKEQNQAVQIVAVEPRDSTTLSGGRAGAHKIQDIGAGYVPEVLDASVYDEIILVRHLWRFVRGAGRMLCRISLEFRNWF